MDDEEADPMLEGEEQSPWVNLPDLVIERVFSYLTMCERYYCSIVCRRWHAAFYLPHVWAVFVFDEKTLTRRRFNYYSGWQYTLDHLRAQLCLGTVGRNFRVLIFNPMTNFYNMYEFMNMLSYYAEQQGADRFTVKGVGKFVHTLRYTFPCNLLARNDDDQVQRLYGTGGKLLAAVKRLMGNLAALRHIELTDLMLDAGEAKTLLDEVAVERCAKLKTLSLVNMTKTLCAIIHPGVFVNLRVLVLSPQNLSEDLLELLGQSRLPTLHLCQTQHSPSGVAPLSPKAWKTVSTNNKILRVHLTLEARRPEKEIIWQERAPVASILYNSPHSALDGGLIGRAVEWYRDTLQTFGHVGIPRFSSPKSFTDRTDPLLLMLVRECPHLSKLAIRERVSTCTLLLIAEAGQRCLKDFYVRRNAVILRCDWPINPEWSPEYYKWLKTTSQSYSRSEAAVSKLLGRPWTMMSDKEFMRLRPSLY